MNFMMNFMMLTHRFLLEPIHELFAGAAMTVLGIHGDGVLGHGWQECRGALFTRREIGSWRLLARGWGFMDGDNGCFAHGGVLRV